ncbi:MAG: hypothetical protein M3441_13415 [Chloroflexota bacterium]|nr:hypothetical protein [Chloroflexota bacterium]
MTKAKIRRVPCIAGLAFLLLLLAGGTWAIFLVLQKSPDPLEELRAVPLYPNAQSVKVTGGSDHDASLTFTTTATSRDVFAFYDSELTSANGWMAHPGGNAKGAGFFRLYFNGEERVTGFQFTGFGDPPFFGAPWVGPTHEPVWHIVYVTTRIPWPYPTQRSDGTRILNPALVPVESVELYIQISPATEDVNIRPR